MPPENVAHLEDHGPSVPDELPSRVYRNDRTAGVQKFDILQRPSSQDGPEGHRQWLLRASRRDGSVYRDEQK